MSRSFLDKALAVILACGACIWWFWLTPPTDHRGIPVDWPTAKTDRVEVAAEG